MLIFSCAILKAARHASEAASALCEARGLRTQLELMRDQYAAVRRNSNPIPHSSSAGCSGGGGNETIDLDKAKVCLLCRLAACISCIITNFVMNFSGFCSVGMWRSCENGCCQP